MNTTAVCPFQSAAKDFRPYYSPELHAAFEVQRRTEPVFWCEEIGYWVLTKHSDVYAVLHDGVRFSSENTTRPVTPMCPEAMAILKEEGYARPPATRPCTARSTSAPAPSPARSSTCANSSSWSRTFAAW